MYNNSEIEIVTEVIYLGLLFSKTGSFIHAKKYLIKQASKSMFAVLKKYRLFNLSIDCQLDLFDKILKPILLYGCEIWGFSNLDRIERFHLKFCKYVLCVCNIKAIRSPWISFIKGILDECGLCNIYSCTQVNVLWLKHTVKRILCDQYLQQWNSEKCNSSRGINYRMFKQ